MATDTEGEIVNKIKQNTKLVTIDLEKYYDDTPVIELDLKDFLFKGLILKEQEYRELLEQHDWEQYKGAYLTAYCSTDAIIPKWAFMLVARHARPFAKEVFFGTAGSIRFELYRRNLDRIDWSEYADKFVLLKGCSDRSVPESVYLYATQKLLPYVKKLMYGEACSNVPVFRK